MLSRQAVRYLSSRPVRRGRIAECGFVRFCAELKAALRCPVNDFNNNYNNNVSTAVKAKRYYGRRFNIPPMKPEQPGIEIDWPN